MLGDKHRITGWHPVVWQHHPVAHFDHKLIYRIMHFFIMIIVHAWSFVLVEVIVVMVVVVVVVVEVRQVLTCKSH